VRLHDRADAVEVTVEGLLVGVRLHCGREPADQMVEHVVIAHELGDHRFELGMRGDDLREQAGVLAAVVALESGAEPAAEDEQILAGNVLEFAVDRTASEVQCPTELLVDGTKLGAESDQAVGLGIDLRTPSDTASRPMP
jgi:hypothetical protein